MMNMKRDNVQMIRGRIAALAAGIFLSAFASLAAPAAAAPSPSGIVTYNVVGGEGVHDQVPVTFGAIFAKGDVPPGTSVVAKDKAGHDLPSQIDIKAKHPDGSLRHAVVTVVIPHLAKGDEFPVTLVRGALKQTPPLNIADLPPDFDAKVDLSLDGKHLMGSARDLIAHSKPQTWLSGSLVTEWWVAGPLRDAQGKADPHMAVRFGIRSYGKGQPVRVEADIENAWTWVPSRRTEVYDARISVGGKSAFEKAGMIQPVQTRWRKVFWLNAAADAYVKQDLDYLKKARVIPNYGAKSANLSGAVSDLYAEFQRSKHDPLEPGIILPYMPTTGGRGDIAPLPSWTALYLLTMDKRAYDVTMQTGDLSGGFGSHYRNEKTGRPTTSEEYPYLSTHSNYVGRPKNLETPITGGHDTPLVAQTAHEPSLAFIPYLVTGDRYYLEELQFWSQWNSWGTAPEYRGFKDGLVNWDEVRGQAWSLRTLAQAAYITPDSDPMKATLLRELAANFKDNDKKFTHNRNASMLHIIMNPGSHGVGEYSPWMDDYLTWAAGYVVQLGFEVARPFAQWKAEYPVQRMINPGYCWIMATPYRMIAQHPDGSFFTSWADTYKATFEFAAKVAPPPGLQCGGSEMARMLNVLPGEMMGGAQSPGGYPGNLQPALAAAVDLNVKGARDAWEKFQARPVKPRDGMAPQWDIVPWGGG